MDLQKVDRENTLSKNLKDDFNQMKIQSDHKFKMEEDNVRNDDE